MVAAERPHGAGHAARGGGGTGIAALARIATVAHRAVGERHERGAHAPNSRRRSRGVAMSAAPDFRVLTQHECIALLLRNVVGRLAFVRDGRPDVRPLHYRFEGGWIYGRMSEGSTLAALAGEPWVAFVVDEVDDAFAWASVVVRGTFHRLAPDEREVDLAPAAYATSQMRAVVPGTLAEGDPAPHRTVLYRISIGEMTGRRAVPGSDG